MAPGSFITPGGVFDGRDFCAAIRPDAPGGSAPAALRLFTKLAAAHRRAPPGGGGGGVTPEAAVVAAVTGATAVAGGTAAPIDVVAAYLAYRPGAPDLFALLADRSTPAVTAVAAVDALTAILSAVTPAPPGALAVAADVAKGRAAAILGTLSRHRRAAARSVLRLLAAASRTAPAVAAALAWRYDLAAAGTTAGLGRPGTATAAAYRELLTGLLRGGEPSVAASLGGPNRAALAAALRAVRVGDGHRGAALCHAVRLYLVPRGGAARAVLAGPVLDALAALAVTAPPAAATAAEPPPSAAAAAAVATPAGAVHVLRMDVGDDDSVATAVAAVLAVTAGRVDVVVANAGYGTLAATEDAAVADFARVMNVNYFGALRLVKAALPAMRRRRAGRVVGVSSVAGVLGIPFYAPYCASKFAMEGLWESCYAEYQRLGVHFVIVRWGGSQGGSQGGAVCRGRCCSFFFLLAVRGRLLRFLLYTGARAPFCVA